ncbi:hypothetical protein DFO77_110101 [Marinilabilia salmonicolor]|jgi:hypothetical protein|uniref:Uncharacterized protein n=1 Tax=Marinilabilia salmonicolor TaxID=989 RepID=A0A2T0XET2_9BACT|nr:hypothetical protein BY457_112121 [Marinilabilia salmonicolor]RCW35334.1 hypothetical protein DFO77_110101 [Marinilabilia salmonicolor]
MVYPINAKFNFRFFINVFFGVRVTQKNVFLDEILCFSDELIHRTDKNKNFLK